MGCGAAGGIDPIASQPVLLAGKMLPCAAGGHWLNIESGRVCADAAVGSLARSSVSARGAITSREAAGVPCSPTLPEQGH